jgi:hypothetical protein
MHPWQLPIVVLEQRYTSYQGSQEAVFYHVQMTELSLEQLRVRPRHLFRELGPFDAPCDHVVRCSRSNASLRICTTGVHLENGEVDGLAHTHEQVL